MSPAGSIMDLNQETLDALRSLVDKAYAPGEVQRDITTALGLKAYDLQAPAKSIVPFIYSLVGMTPRVPGKGDTQTHWLVYTGINTSNLEGGTPEGDRSLVQTSTASSKTASYATVGLEDAVTFEANLASQGFEDLRARTVMNLLLAGRLAEEKMALGGNTSTALGTPVVATPTTATTGGSLAGSQTIHVRCVALTRAGYENSSVAGGVPTAVSGTSPAGESISYGGGSSIASVDKSVAVPAGTNTNTVSATVTAVSGAVAYAWFWGTDATTNCLLGAITTINSVLITDVAGGTAHADTYSADNSENAYAFDGLLTQAFASGGSITTLATGTAGTGTKLTASGYGTISEIDTMLKSLWDNYRVSPKYLLVNSQQLLDIYSKVINNGGSPLIRFNLDAASGDRGMLAGGVIGSYFNMFTVDGGSIIRIVLHPYMPPGTILALTDQIPGTVFPGSNTGKLWELHMQQDWHQIEWPLRTRKYETGTYTREVLAHYFPASMGVLTNIAAG